MVLDHIARHDDSQSLRRDLLAADLVLREAAREEAQPADPAEVAARDQHGLPHAAHVPGGAGSGGRATARRCVNSIVPITAKLATRTTARRISAMQATSARGVQTGRGA
jgi:hypothetical protein